MELGTALQGATLLTLLGAFIFHFVRSPKEEQGQQSARITALETAHQTLALRFERSSTEHESSIEHLTAAIRELTGEVKSLQLQMAGTGNARRR